MADKIVSFPDLTKLTLGFLGCGKISNAMVKGLCTLREKPKAIFVSKRNEIKSSQLKEAYPNIVEVSESNEYIVSNSDIVFLGLLPATAREILPKLNFQGKFVVSILAAVDYAEILQLTSVAPDACLKIVPLPSVSNGWGPIVAYPKQSKVDHLIRLLGTLCSMDTEIEMKPIIAITGHISPFFELMKTTQDFLKSKGIPDDISRSYVASFYAGLSRTAELSEDTFGELTEEAGRNMYLLYYTMRFLLYFFRAATPGGLNEQAYKFMSSTTHYEVQTQSLEDIYKRLTKK